jgi:hypothetical protein
MGSDGVIESLRKLKVPTELVLSSTNLTRIRRSFDRRDEVARSLATMAAQHNLSGWNVDFEPLHNSTPADAADFSVFLSVLRTSIGTHHDCRLTVDVGGAWSPMIANYSVLAGSVDRMMDMETYQGINYSDWLQHYEAMVPQFTHKVLACSVSCIQTVASFSYVGCGVFTVAVPAIILAGVNDGWGYAHTFKVAIVNVWTDKCVAWSGWRVVRESRAQGCW